MKKGNHGQHFDEQFKKMISELIESSQKSLSENHRKHGVSKVTIYRRMKIYGED